MISKIFVYVVFAILILVGTCVNVWLMWTDASYSHFKAADALFGIGGLVIYCFGMGIINHFDLDRRYERNRNWRLVEKMREQHRETP